MKRRILAFGVGFVGLLIAGCSTAPQPQDPPPRARQGAAQAPGAPVATSTESVVEPEAVLRNTVAISPQAAAVVERFTQGTDGALLHQQVENTGFPAAMATLQAGVFAPGVDKPQGLSNQPPARGLTADGRSAELVERDWSGVVLVPVIAQVSKAYTSGVRLTAIEAHPLKDGRVRVWTRVRNITGAPMAAEVACTYRMQGDFDMTSPRFYYLGVPAGEFRDVFFVSGAGVIDNYTVLVRSSSR